MTLTEFDALPADEAAAALRKCCGSERWVLGVLGERPFGDRLALDAAVSRQFDALQREDWLEAFSHHPRIGDRKLDAAAATKTESWSAQEQAGTQGAEQETMDRLRAGNVAYEQRFGHVYLVCATGKTAAEMLAMLDQRLGHGADEELLVAATEQRKITAIRLEKLFGVRY
jgi:2-oxo-4-hydroxy-4-carboxy-5-ureidoimidazoline decarboxylase